MSSPDLLDPMRPQADRPVPTPAGFDAPLATDAAFDAARPDAALDARLHALIASGACPAPAGFTRRVMDALPPLPAAPVARPSRPARATRRARPRWQAAVLLLALVVAVAVGRTGRTRSDVPSAAEVAQARANVELAFALLGDAQAQAEATAADVLTR